jgi:hypothetical protein
MKYTKALDIWRLKPQEIERLQPGQWVYAGERNSMGRYLGVRRSGSLVVGWLGNARNHSPRKSYYRALRNYALGC